MPERKPWETPIEYVPDVPTPEEVVAAKAKRDLESELGYRSKEEVDEIINRPSRPPRSTDDRKPGEFASHDTSPVVYKNGDPNASFGIDE